MSETDAMKEARGHRHDFIKEYYKMATMDLDRHLKGGWQTIVVLAGGVAILVAGHENKVELPIAVAIALLISYWGAATVIDSNYWSVRAIAFLSNVEAIYFSSEDRRNFNPYVGFFPKYKFLDSLRHMYILCLGFGVISLLSLGVDVFQTASTFQAMQDWYWRLAPFEAGLWGLPIPLALWFVVGLNLAWRKRMVEYRDFARDCPGPGVRKTILPYRDVALNPVGDTAVVLEQPQSSFVQELDVRISKKRWTFVWGLLAVIATAAIIYRVGLGVAAAG